MTESAEYIRDIIRYFENQAKRAESNYQFEEQKKNNNSIIIISLINIILLIYLTTTNTAVSSGFSITAMVVDMTPAERLATSNSTDALFDTIAKNQSENRILLGVIVVLFVGMLLNGFLTTKEMGTLENEISSVNVIISALYLLKLRWDHKLAEQNVKKSLLRFNIPIKAYENTLLELIDKFEGEEQSAQELSVVGC